MKPLRVALIVALSLAGAPDLSEADGRRGGGGGQGFRGSGTGRHGFHRHGHRGFHGHGHHGFHGHGFQNRFFYYPYVPTYAAPSVIVSNPVVVYTPPPVYAAPQYYAPPAAYAAPPAMPRVVEYPGGRYELRGDGVSSPYSWVWIPDPPAAPPPPPVPAPPASAPEPSLALRVAGPRAVAYRWTDESGVTTWTDNLEKVPARFRAQPSQSAVTQ